MDRDRKAGLLAELRSRQDELVRSLATENTSAGLAAQSKELEQVLDRIQELEQA
jgi:hypothetical protein